MFPNVLVLKSIQNTKPIYYAMRLLCVNLFETSLKRIMVCRICVAYAFESFHKQRKCNIQHLYYTWYFYQNRVYFGVIQKLCFFFKPLWSHW